MISMQRHTAGLRLELIPSDRFNNRGEALGCIHLLSNQSFNTNINILYSTNFYLYNMMNNLITSKKSIHNPNNRLSLQNGSEQMVRPISHEEI